MQTRQLAELGAVELQIAAVGIIKDQKRAIQVQQLGGFGDMARRDRRIGGDQIRKAVDREDQIEALSLECREIGAIAHREIDIGEVGATRTRFADHNRRHIDAGD